MSKRTLDKKVTFSSFTVDSQLQHKFFKNLEW